MRSVGGRLARRRPAFRSRKSAPASLALLLDLVILTGVTLLSIGWTARAIRIIDVVVPQFVENGTAESVVLDCIYSYSLDEDRQLVVKWFFNRDPKPIYQWIPDLNRRSYSKSRFEGHIDREFAIAPSPALLAHRRRIVASAGGDGNDDESLDKYTRYRALRIMRPTTEMSGSYSCSVTSLQGQDTKTKDMIVYAKPRRFSLSFRRPADSSETQFKCQVEGIFPQPQLHMYRVEQTRIAGNDYTNVANMTEALNYSVQPAGHQRRAAKDGYLTVLTTSLSNRLFRLSAQSSKARRHLFFCVYTIPSTDIKQTRVLEFYPERFTSAAWEASLHGGKYISTALTCALLVVFSVCKLLL